MTAPLSAVTEFRAFKLRPTFSEVSKGSIVLYHLPDATLPLSCGVPSLCRLLQRSDLQAREIPSAGSGRDDNPERRVGNRRDLDPAAKIALRRIPFCVFAGWSSSWAPVRYKMPEDTEFSFSRL